MDNKSGLNTASAKGVIFIFLLALFLRLIFLAVYDTMPRKDAVSMDRIAWSLAKGEGYVWPDGSATAHRPPVYPFFLSVIYRLFGHDYKAVKIIQCLLVIDGRVYAQVTDIGSLNQCLTGVIDHAKQLLGL